MNKFNLEMVRPVGFEPNETGNFFNNFNRQKPPRTHLERVACSVLILFFIACQLISCSGGTELPPPYQGATVKDVTIKGESFAAYLPCSFFEDAGLSCENDGVPTATIEHLLQYPDDRSLKTVIVFTGLNTLGKTAGGNVVYTLNQYVALLAGIEAKRKICIGLPPNKSLNNQIMLFNDGLKELCGAENYVDTWAIVALPAPIDGDYWAEGMTNDGCHLSDAANSLLAVEIIHMINSAP